MVLEGGVGDVETESLGLEGPAEVGRCFLEGVFAARGKGRDLFGVEAGGGEAEMREGPAGTVVAGGFYAVVEGVLGEVDPAVGADWGGWV